MTRFLLPMVAVLALGAACDKAQTPAAAPAAPAAAPIATAEPKAPSPEDFAAEVKAEITEQNVAGKVDALAAELEQELSALE
jgi:hypothetical protein